MRGRKALAAAGLLLGLALLSPLILPYNMDEFVPYQALGCAAFPLSARENGDFRNGCGRLDLRLPFTRTFLPLRSYTFIGSLPVVPFYPLWRLLRDPVAVRVQGVLFLLLAFGLALRVTEAAAPALLVALCIYPLCAASFIVDTGPVGLSMVLALGTLVAVKRAVHERRPARKAGFAALAGLLVFLGLFVKPVFAWLLPGFALFALARARAEPPPARALSAENARALAAFLAASVPLTLALGLAHTRTGGRYYGVFRSANVGMGSGQPRVVASRLSEFVLDGSTLAPQTLRWPRQSWDAVPALLCAGLLAWGLRRVRETATWLAMAALAFGLMCLTGRAWASHHIVFAIDLVLLGLAGVLTRLRAVHPRTFRVCTVAVCLYWAGLAARFPRVVVNPEANSGKDRLLAYVRESGLDARSVQLHATWGTYFIGHLFGDPRQILLFANRFATVPAYLTRARQIAEARGRSIVIISRREPEGMRTRGDDGILGPPQAVHRFDGWWAVEYLRQASPSHE
jgi:hypothetical protein